MIGPPLPELDAVPEALLVNPTPEDASVEDTLDASVDVTLVVTPSVALDDAPPEAEVEGAVSHADNAATAARSANVWSR